jgi:VanZ family protein
VTVAPVPPSRRAWWAVGVWLLFQLTLTTVPGDVLPSLPGFRIDWVAHFCLYFGLGFLIARAALVSKWSAAKLAAVWVAIAVFGVLDEFHEELIPGRGAELMDWIMDATGSWTGLVTGYVLTRTRWAQRLLQ